jgi:hypothetical protein
MDDVSCPHMASVHPGVGWPEASGGSLMLTHYGSTFRRDSKFTAMFQAARQQDPRLRGFHGESGSGKCEGGAAAWDHEDFWIHTPETQLVHKPTNPDGFVFCYTKPDGTRVLAWTQNTSMNHGTPFIGVITAPSEEDAFGYFYLVHHNIGMTT